MGLLLREKIVLFTTNKSIQPSTVAIEARILITTIFQIPDKEEWDG